jgi:hypothetical protein
MKAHLTEPIGSSSWAKSRVLKEAWAEYDDVEATAAAVREACLAETRSRLERERNPETGGSYD